MQPTEFPAVFYLPREQHQWVIVRDDPDDAPNPVRIERCAICHDVVSIRKDLAVKIWNG
jgi:hypothetical protein